MKAAAPTLVSFAVTRECNLKCKHCYSQSVDSPHPRELNTAEAKRLISQIAESGAHLIILDGGEPLMRPDVFDLVSHSRSVGLTTVMGTNGTLITTEVAAKLVEAGIQALESGSRGRPGQSSANKDACSHPSADARRAEMGIRVDLVEKETEQ